MSGEVEGGGQEVVLRLTDITKRFPGVTALAGVSFDCRRAEVHALAGENGAGKSTLIKVMSGAHRPDLGTIDVLGVRYSRLTPLLARRAGIGVIYQEFNLFPDLTVAENIYFGKEPKRRFGSLDYSAMRRGSEALLDQLGARIDVGRLVRDLSVAQQQLVEIAKALAEEAQILVMDEPSAVLAGDELEELFGVVRNLRATGRSIVYISHRLDEVFAIADRVSVLKDGRSVGTWRTDEVAKRDLVRAMVGRDLGDYPRRRHDLGDVALRVRELSVGHFLCDVSLELRAGEILGIGGLVGSGRSTLARALVGLEEGTTGRVEAGALGASNDGLALVPEDRKRDGLFPEKTVGFNISLPSLGELATTGLIRRRAEHRLVDQWIEELGVRVQTRSTAVDSLSGGNQQKVLLARWLATSPRVLIVDEPTRGIDVGAKAEIYKLLRKLTERGMAIVMVSSELPELLGMSDRILVVRDGRLSGEIAAADASEELVMALATGSGEAA